MTKDKKRTGIGGTIGDGAALAKMAYEGDVGEPSQHDNDAQMFSKIGQAFSNPGQRPRGILRNLGAGLAEGAAHGTRSKGIEEKKDKNQKLQEAIDYWQKANKAAMEQNQWYEKREMAKKEMLPQVMAYMDNIERLDPQSQRIMAQDMLGQYGEAIGENFKLSSIDGSNPFLMTIQSDKGQQLFDMRSVFAGDEAMQQSIAMKMPAYQMKLQQERADKEREFKLKEDKLALEEKYMPDKYAVQREKLQQTTRRNDQNALKSDVKLSETLGKKIDASKEFLTIAPKMEKIVKDHPDIFQSAIDAVWRESKEPGYLNNMVKAAQNTMNPEKVAALTSMVKYINKMTLDVANGFARPNMFIEKIGSKAVPNLDMSPDGFMNVLQEMKEENQKSIKNNLQRFDLLKSDVDSGIADQYRDSVKDVAIPENTVWVKNPETGEETEIDANQLDHAVEAGYEYVRDNNGS